MTGVSILLLLPASHLLMISADRHFVQIAMHASAHEMELSLDSCGLLTGVVVNTKPQPT